MSGHKLRKEKNCLNCGHTVEEHYCSHCGQENIETRQPFHYLFTHFFEDLTHYDGQVWKTFRFLLTKPGRLTKEFLAGRRMRYVPPVRLYIFMSFVAFLLPALLSHTKEKPGKDALIKELEDNKKELAEGAQEPGSGISEKKVKEYSYRWDSIINGLKSGAIKPEDYDENANWDVSFDKNYKGIESTHQFDSIQKVTPRKTNWLATKLARKQIELRQAGLSKKQASEKLRETFIHNLPKALFIYLPLFAFWLWLFHNKKKWWYFDHGIFTLHYFSFLLTVFSACFLLNYLVGFIPNSDIAELGGVIIFCVALMYSFFYFFRAHSNVYAERKRMSRFKGMLLFLINMVFMLIFLIALFFISFYNLH